MVASLLVLLVSPRHQTPIVFDAEQRETRSVALGDSDRPLGYLLRRCGPRFPSLRIATTAETRQNYYLVGVHGIDHAVGKSSYRRAPRLTFDDLVGERVTLNVRNCRFDG